MNRLEQLAIDLPKSVKKNFEKSLTEDGTSWLDIFLNNDQRLAIEWNPRLGYGLYINPDNSFGSGPDEVYRNLDILDRRIKMILDTRQKEISIKDLRKLSGKTQSFISEVTGKGQPSISKLENQRDFQLSTLEEYISALGGYINISVHFKDFDIPIDLFDPTDSTNKKELEKEI